MNVISDQQISRPYGDFDVYLIVFYFPESINERHKCKVMYLSSIAMSRGPPIYA